MKSGRKYAVSAWVWTSDIASNNFLALKKESEMGFDGIEIPTFDGRLDSDRIKDVLDSFSIEKKLSPIIIGGGLSKTNIASENLSTRRAGIEYLKRCVSLCSELGGSLVCGPLYTAVGEFGGLTESEREKIYQSVSRSFKDLCNFARNNRIRIALEPLCRYDTHLVNTTAQGMKLIEMIDEENVGLLLDTFHLNIEEKSVSRAIRTVRDKLFHFHASENDRGTPGSGQIRWDQVARSLDQINYEEWIGIESFTPFEKDFSSVMHVWRTLERSQDDIAVNGLKFLKSKFG
jgi:D-psicose/D-tagatose/L-ribulose 3-epimerase